MKCCLFFVCTSSLLILRNTVRIMSSGLKRRSSGVLGTEPSAKVAKGANADKSVKSLDARTNKFRAKLDALLQMKKSFECTICYAWQADHILPSSQSICAKCLKQLPTRHDGTVLDPHSRKPMKRTSVGTSAALKSFLEQMFSRKAELSREALALYIESGDPKIIPEELDIPEQLKTLFVNDTIADEAKASRQVLDLAMKAPVSMLTVAKDALDAAKKHATERLAVELLTILLENRPESQRKHIGASFVHLAGYFDRVDPVKVLWELSGMDTRELDIMTLAEPEKRESAYSQLNELFSDEEEVFWAPALLTLNAGGLAVLSAVVNKKESAAMLTVDNIVTIIKTCEKCRHPRQDLVNGRIDVAKTCFTVATFTDDMEAVLNWDGTKATIDEILQILESNNEDFGKDTIMFLLKQFSSTLFEINLILPILLEVFPLQDRDCSLLSVATQAPLDLKAYKDVLTKLHPLLTRPEVSNETLLGVIDHLSKTTPIELKSIQSHLGREDTFFPPNVKSMTAWIHVVCICATYGTRMNAMNRALDLCAAKLPDYVPSKRISLEINDDELAALRTRSPSVISTFSSIMAYIQQYITHFNADIRTIWEQVQEHLRASDKDFVAVDEKKELVNFRQLATTASRSISIDQLCGIETLHPVEELLRDQMQMLERIKTTNLHADTWYARMFKELVKEPAEAFSRVGGKAYTVVGLWRRKQRETRQAPITVESGSDSGSELSEYSDSVDSDSDFSQ